MQDILNGLRESFAKYADKDVAANSHKFFKEDVNFYGITTKIMKDIDKQTMKLLKGKSKKEVFWLCEELFKSTRYEESIAACNASYFIKDQFEKSDLAVFENWIDKYVTNWATCDVFCNHTMGDFVMMYPEVVKDMKKWTPSKNRWKKRAAAVTFIIPARKGMFLKDVFEIADGMLLDGDDMVQKGYGWMLKAASEAHPKEVFDYVMSRKAVMPRTAFRYALEKMPKEWREIAMKK